MGEKGSTLCQKDGFNGIRSAASAKKGAVTGKKASFLVRRAPSLVGKGHDFFGAKLINPGNK